MQVALYMRAVEELLGLEAAGGFYQPLSGGTCARGAVLDGESGVEIECVRGEVREHAEVRELLAQAVARHARRRRGGTRRTGAPPAHVRVSGWLYVSDDLPVRGMTQLSFDERAVPWPILDRADPTTRMLTKEQEQAVKRRREPLLLAAGAGSGKTSVLVERFVRAVREDGVAPGRILAITFTERAAGELRERVRARFVELGEREAARDTEAAFVSTFHGFCARLLRVHPLAAGLDPDFEILDEGLAARLRGQAWTAALRGFLEGERGDAVDLVAAWGADRVRAMVAGDVRGAAQQGRASAEAARLGLSADAALAGSRPDGP